MTSKPTARAARVWTRLSEFYGARFTDQFGAEPSTAWCEVIDDLSNIDIKRSLSLVRAEHPSHPPTLGEFEKLAKPAKRAATSPQQYTIQEQLCAFVMRNRKLTQSQVRRPWLYRYERAQWRDIKGDQRDEPAECVAVDVPGDGEAHPGIRVTVEDMLTGQASFGSAA